MLAAAGHSTSTRPTRCATAGRWTPGGAMIAAQGGDPSAPLPVAPREARRDRAGVRRAHPARRAAPSASAAWRLGAGRARKEDAVSAGAGVVLLAKPGDAVRRAQPLLELHADDPARFERRAGRRSTAASRSATSYDGVAARARPHRLSSVAAATSLTDRSDSLAACPPRSTSTRSARRPRCCCTTISTAACGRRPSSNSPHEIGYRRLPATRRRRARPAGSATRPTPVRWSATSRRSRTPWP